MPQFDNQCEFWRNFIAQLLFGVKNGAKIDQQHAQKHKRTQFDHDGAEYQSALGECRSADWHLGVLIGTLNFALTFCIFFYAFS